ncbi:MAG: hypothetical protein A3H32_12925 [Betaproteobacteria bacterium RIFCSPLOWO2_02_FULL_63_19]|nr:MAG: hypothetical protein A3H32_12925 [Betaproteobacteria bacterium RIFCSPLOWO2_02_FULL_63_19]
MDYDAIIVGGGPAGLAAGIHLSRARNRVLLLDRESFGGQIMNVEWVEDAPGSEVPVAGAMFASRMVDEAEKCGVQMELGEVVEIESYSECKSVRCADGRGYTSAVVIVAGGLNPRKLGVPGEDHFLHKGVIHCALCDAGLYAGQAVAVCGGGYAGLTEALYLAKHASKVYLLEAQPRLSAPVPLQERAVANPRLEIRCEATVLEIAGDKFVTGVRIRNAASGQSELLAVSGVLARVGFEPATGYLEGVLSLDDRGAVIASEQMETDVPGIVVAGDTRSGSPRTVAAAVSDGTTAAKCARRLLQTVQS